MPALRRMFRLMNRRADGIMANSLEAKRIAVETEELDPERVKVVYQGVDMSKFSRGAGRSDRRRKNLESRANARVVDIIANCVP